MSAETYTASDIKVLEGLEAVRKRPAMYIGDTGAYGLHHLVYEVVDNSVDEALAGHCDSIKIILHSDGSCSVGDNGRGIPVDTHLETGKSAAEVVLTVLHAGGKFEHSAYKVSGGLHGVGVSVVNALSEWLEVEIRRGGKTWTQRYEKGGVPTAPLAPGEKTTKHGTIIRFKPDATIFEVTEFSFDTLSNRLRELAFLNRGLKIVIEDERDGRSHTFLYKGGIIEFIKHLNQNKTPIHPKVMFFEGKKGDIEVEVALQYNDGYQESVFSFANNINTREGGTHLTGFRAALTGQLSGYAQNNGFLKNFKGGVSGDDVREGLCAVVSVRLPDPQFEGQTKAKLGNTDIKGLVQQIVNEKLAEAFEEDPTTARKIADKCVRAVQGALSTNQITRFTGSFSGPGGVDGLTDDPLRDNRVLFKELAQLVVDDGLDDALHLGVAKLRLGLPFELWPGDLDADHARQTLSDIVAADAGVLEVLGEIVLDRVRVDRPGQCGAESREVRSPLVRVDVVGEREHHLRVGVVPLQRDLGVDAVLVAFHEDRPLVDDRLVLVQMLHERDDATFVLETMALAISLVVDRDENPAIEEG